MTPRPSILWRAVALTVTAGVALGGAGCGNADHTGPGYASKDIVAQEDAADAPLTRDQIMPAAYRASMKAGSAHMTMRMSGQAATKAEGDVSYAGGTSAMRMTMSMPQMGKGKIEMRYVDQLIYMQLPGMTQPGKFIAIDPKDQSSPLGKNFSGLTDQMDPLSSVKSMEAAVTSVDRVGRGQVGGVSVDHYRVLVDTAQMLKKLGQASPQGMPRSLTYQMWLDNKNLIRKMTFAAAGTSVEIQLSKWGEPVTVKRPADGDLVKAPGA